MEITLKNDGGVLHTIRDEETLKRFLANGWEEVKPKKNAKKKAEE